MPEEKKELEQEKLAAEALGEISGGKMSLEDVKDYATKNKGKLAALATTIIALIGGGAYLNKRKKGREVNEEDHIYKELEKKGINVDRITGTNPEIYDSYGNDKL